MYFEVILAHNPENHNLILFCFSYVILEASCYVYTGSSSGWDDSPRWKKDEFADWDPDKGGGMSRGSGRHGSRNFDDAGNNR